MLRPYPTSIYIMKPILNIHLRDRTTHELSLLVMLILLICFPAFAQEFNFVFEPDSIPVKMKGGVHIAPGRGARGNPVRNLPTSMLTVYWICLWVVFGARYRILIM